MAVGGRYVAEVAFVRMRTVDEHANCQALDGKALQHLSIISEPYGAGIAGRRRGAAADTKFMRQLLKRGLRPA